MAGLGKMEIELACTPEEVELNRQVATQKALDTVFLITCMATIFVIEGHWKLFICMFIAHTVINSLIKWQMARKSKGVK